MPEPILWRTRVKTPSAEHFSSSFSQSIRVMRWLKCSNGSPSEARPITDADRMWQRSLHGKGFLGGPPDGDPMSPYQSDCAETRNLVNGRAMTICYYPSRFHYTILFTSSPVAFPLLITSPFLVKLLRIYNRQKR